MVATRKAKTVSRSRLSVPLKADSRVNLQNGYLLGSDLIGRHTLDEIAVRVGNNPPQASAGVVTIHEPSLAAYIVLQPRLCTPIYPQDAALMVSFLDIGLPVPGEDPAFDAAPPFEVLDAGTGAGSLALHLARAIHGANPPVPRALREAVCASQCKSHAQVLLSDTPPSSDPHPFDFPDPSLQRDLEAFRSRRRAVVHSIDISQHHSRGAHDLIRGFKRAQYLLDIDFHVCSISKYLRTRLSGRGGEPFLAHAILDLPSPTEDAAAVVRALRPDGLLLVFQPSISQVADLAAWVRQTGQPLRLELSIELPQAVDRERDLLDGTGGREWDVRFLDSNDGATSVRRGTASVCRPKVGGTVSGGGFFAVFRRLRDAL